MKYVYETQFDAKAIQNNPEFCIISIAKEFLK